MSRLVFPNKQAKYCCQQPESSKWDHRGSAGRMLTQYTPGLEFKLVTIQIRHGSECL